MNILYSARHFLRRSITKYPSVYLPIARLRSPGLAVVKDSELVLEGYPRCGNSYAEAALRLPQGRSLKLAHHCHAIAQVLYAVRNNKPCLVLVRAPIDVVASFCEKSGGKISPRLAMQEYLDFYGRLDAIVDRCVVARFETVTEDFSKVIDELNQCYNLNLDNWPNGVVDKKQVMDEVERLNFERNGTHTTGYGSKATKSELERRKNNKEEILRKISNPKLRSLLDECERIYGNILS